MFYHIKEEGNTIFWNLFFFSKVYNKIIRFTSLSSITFVINKLQHAPYAIKSTNYKLPFLIYQNA